MPAGGDLADARPVACGVIEEIDWPPPWCEPCKDFGRRCDQCVGATGWCEHDCPDLYEEDPCR